MAAGGEGWYHANYFHDNWYHDEWWAEAGAAGPGGPPLHVLQFRDSSRRMLIPFIMTVMDKLRCLIL